MARRRYSRLGIDWDAEPLGKSPDAVIARRLNVDVATVRYARTTRGIALTDEARLAGRRLQAAGMRRMRSKMLYPTAAAASILLEPMSEDEE